MLAKDIGFISTSVYSRNRTFTTLELLHWALLAQLAATFEPESTQPARYFPTVH